MEIKKTMQDVLNKQLNMELSSGYIYYAMAAYFDSINLSGFGKWMQFQAKEEQKHAQKIYSFINDRGGRVQLTQIPTPKESWKSALDAINDAYHHEQKVTAAIHNLMDLANKEKDHATVAFLNWFVNEQVEEEANAAELVEQLKMIGDSKQGLFIMDKNLHRKE